MPSTEKAPCLHIPQQDHHWSTFFERNTGRIAAMIYRDLSRYHLFVPEQEVGEVLQEVQIRLWSKHRSLGRMAPEQVWSYARQTVGNLVRDHFRNEVRRNQALEEFSWATTYDRHPLRPPPSTPEESLLAQEEVEVFLQTCRTMLRRKNREVRMCALRLALVEGCGSEEVSRRLDGNLSVSQVNSLLYRVRRRLVDHGVSLPRRRRHFQGCRVAAKPRVCRREEEVFCRR